MDARTKILHDALTTLGRPNHAIKPTAADALDMAKYARERLAAYDAAGVRDPRVFVSDDRMTLVRMYAAGDVELARRENGGLGIWGPPTALYEETS